jgi:endonuclease/exonuclease/phosphatase family metal-dependent hydrolase
VGTFNIRYANPADGQHAWPRRRDALLRTIELLRCDVIGLQEVLPAQRTWLQARLAGYDWYGVGREDGRTRGEQSPLLVRSGAVTVDDWTTLWLSRTPDVIGSRGVDARTPRVATVLRGALGARRIGLINTHWDHRGRRSRVAAARQIGALTDSDQRAWILCGDLNVTADEEPVRLLDGAGLSSVLPIAAPPTFHAFHGGCNGQRIDHVLASRHWTVVDAYVERSRPGGVLPSDHWPVVAELRLDDPVSDAGDAA